MFNHKLFIYLTLSMGLIFVSGSFLTGFQLWVSYLPIYAHSDAQTSITPEIASGIRQIISTSSKPKVVVSDPVSPLAPREEPIKRVSPIKPISSPLFAQPSLHKTNSLSPKKVKAQAKIEPVMVVYDDEIILEFPKVIASKDNMRSAIMRVLLSDKTLGSYDLLTSTKLNLSKKPYLYLHVLNEKQQPIRYPKQAYAYIKNLLAHHADSIQDEEGTFIQVHIPLVEAGLKGSAKNYQAWVKNYADEFDVDPALVYAIMETESHFNPKAVSHSRAIGLMQLKPYSAGRDVYQYVDGKSGVPSIKELFDSNNNIRMGTAYLGLLQHDYLGLVDNPKIQKMLTISSYNGGLSTVLKLFAKTPEKAIERVNQMTPSQVYHKLRFQHHSEETRRYLDKVLAAEQRYQKILDVKRL